MSDRYAEFRDIARTIGVDAVALAPGPNFARLLRKNFYTNERPLVVVIPRDGNPAAIVPNLELRSFDLVGFEGEVFDWYDQTGYQSAFDALIRHLPINSLAVEGQVMRVFVHHAFLAASPGLRIIDAEKVISALRLRKSDAEVAALERAIAISERALAEVLPQIRIGQTEKEIEALLTLAQFAHGAEDHAFSPIVAAGDNSARPHASARKDYRIKAGDALLLDFGARCDGFVSDITRTVFVGHVSTEAEQVYKIVSRANQVGREIARPGRTAHEVDDAVMTVLEASPFADRIRSKTGHGLGRDVHEAPYIMRGNHQKLEAGMVFTDEPGLYQIGSFGVRIEDDVLVTEAGCRSLTNFSRDLTVVG